MAQVLQVLHPSVSYSYMPLFPAPASYYPVMYASTLPQLQPSTIYPPSFPPPLGTQENINDDTIRCFWPPPSPGFVAVNCDASYKPSEKSAGFGVVIRNSTGNVIMCKVNHHRAVHPPRMHEMVVLRLEMLAILEGLRIAKELGYPKVQIQSDSMNAISILVGLIHCPRKCRDIYHATGEEISFFDTVFFDFVYRESNQAADFLSKFLVEDGDRCLDVEELPDELTQIFVDDASGRWVTRVRKASKHD